MRLVGALAVALVAAGCSAGTVPDLTGPTTGATPSASATRAPATPTPPGVCHGLAHVYHPARLRVLAPCVSVRGVIVSARQEPDGDLHVLLRVDADQRDPRGGRFTNVVNDFSQGGNLVLEPVCEGPATQPDAAVAACAGYRNPLVVPPSGTHVVATGPWVLDAPHGWLEIHPLERVEVLT